MIPPRARAVAFCKNRPAFTLVELLVVVAIVALLAALAFPATSRVIQASRATACISNLRNLGAALNLYLQDNKEIMPTLQAGRQSVSQDIPVIDNTLNAYTHDPRVFICPADNLGIGTASGTSYYWNSAINGQSVTNLQFMMINVSATSQPSRIPVITDKQAFHPYETSKVNVLYADGHATADLLFTTSQ